MPKKSNINEKQIQTLLFLKTIYFPPKWARSWTLGGKIVASKKIQDYVTFLLVSIIQVE